MKTSLLDKIPSSLRNKYAVTLFVFFIWLLFFDNNDVISQFDRHQHLEKLKEEKAFYKEHIRSARKELRELTTDPRTLEKFAREKYLMKKENEDIFVIVEEDGQEQE